MQNLINSLTKSTPKLPDFPSIHRSNSTIAPSSLLQSSFFKISGNYTFFIEPKLSSKEKENNSLTQSNIVIINAFTDFSCKYAIAFSCKWYRIINEKSYILPINSNTFQLSAFEIGCSLKCEVKSEEDDYKGVAILSIGPINSDEMLRSDVENIVESSQSKYSVLLVNEIRDLKGKERFVFLVNKENFKLFSMNNTSETRNLIEIQYSINLPEIEVDYSDSLRITLIFKADNPDYEKIRGFLSIKDTKEKLRLGIVFENKNIRDVFLMVFRCLSAKKYLINNKIIEEFGDLDKFLNIQQKNKGFNSYSITDILMEIEKLKKKNDQILQENKELSLETSRSSENQHKSSIHSVNSKENTIKIIEEKRLLEKKVYELESTIKEMKKPEKLFQEFDMKQSFLSDISMIEKFGRDDNITARDFDLENENSLLKNENSLLKNENSSLKNENSSLKNEKRALLEKIQSNNEGFELKMMNEMLKMEVNTYKVQRESQMKEIAHLKETLERCNAKRNLEGTPQTKNKTNFEDLREKVWF